MARGRNFDVIDFAIFCPKALAGIGRFPPTIVDRALLIRMTRRPPGQAAQRLRMRIAADEGAQISARIQRALSGVDVDLILEPHELPVALDDRAQDNWEPLIAIARLAGGEWHQRSIEAALSLQLERSAAEDDVFMTLLADLRAVFDEAGATFLSTTDILLGLCAIEASPWREWKGGRPLSSRSLALLLSEFGVRPEKPTSSERGYSRRPLAELWNGYVSGLPITATTARTATFSAADVEASDRSEGDEGYSHESEAPSLPLPWGDPPEWVT
jgi:hypothetical protein